MSSAMDMEGVKEEKLGSTRDLIWECFKKAPDEV